MGCALYIMCALSIEKYGNSSPLTIKLPPQLEWHSFITTYNIQLSIARRHYRVWPYWAPRYADTNNANLFSFAEYLLFFQSKTCSQTRTTHFSQNCTVTIPFITQGHRSPGYQSWCLNVCLVSTRHAHFRLSNRTAMLKHPSQTTIFIHRKICLKKRLLGTSLHTIQQTSWYLML
jgi:hypothetical protein